MEETNDSYQSLFRQREDAYKQSLSSLLCLSVSDGRTAKLLALSEDIEKLKSEIERSPDQGSTQTRFYLAQYQRLIIKFNNGYRRMTRASAIKKRN